MKRATRNSRGMALVMVLMVVAFATILGYALLSGSSLQVEETRTLSQQAQADCLSESGVNLAVYYLLNPTLAPGYSATNGWYWSGGTGISLGNYAGGTVDVTVTNTGLPTYVAANTYGITSTGHATGSTAVGRKVTVLATLKFIHPYAGEFNTASNVPLSSHTTVSGPLVSASNVTIISGASVAGTIYAPGVTNNGTFSPGVTKTVNPSWAIPSFTDIRYTGTTYTYKGQLCTADTATFASDPTAGTLASPKIITTSGTNNPGHIFYTNRAQVVLNQYVQVQGTLIVGNGRLVTNGGGISITALSGWPALVVKSDLRITGGGASTKDFTVNGLAWVGGGFTHTSTTTNCKVTVNGLLEQYNAVPDSTYTGYMNLNYVAANVNCPDFASKGLDGVAITTWTPQ